MSERDLSVGRLSRALIVLAVVAFWNAAPAGAGIRYSGPFIPFEQAMPGYCSAGVSGTDVSVYLVARNPYGSNVGQEMNYGSGYIQTSLEFDVTMTGNWSCRADYYEGLYYLGWDGQNWNIALQIVDIDIVAFIPQSHYPCPVASPCYWSGNHGHTFGGDNRSFQPGGGFRVKQTASVLAPLAYTSLLTDYDGDTGWTNQYDIQTSMNVPITSGRGWNACNPRGGCVLSAAAYADGSPGHPLKIAWGKAGGGSLVCSVSDQGIDTAILSCTGNENNPLITGSPGISTDFDITFTFGGSSVAYSIDGFHDGFPDYEIYSGTEALYQHGHEAHGQTLASLGPPMEFHAQEDGTIQ